MTDFPIAAILRSPAYSPNHIANDAAILNAVVGALRRRGRKVCVYTERELQQGAVSEPVIISMSREQASLALLREMEYAGRLIINSAYGIDNCRRELLGKRLIGAGINYPDNIVSATDVNILPSLKEHGIERAWVKRADSHAQHKEDITPVFSAEEAQEILHEYFMRGIESAVVEAHIEGILIKFYGVRHTPFFHCFHRLSPGVDLNFNSEELHETCSQAAEAVGLDVYGGDAVFDPKEKKLVIININDWPSYAPCRPEAVKAITGLIQSKVNKWSKTKKSNLSGLKS